MLALAGCGPAQSRATVVPSDTPGATSATPSPGPPPPAAAAGGACKVLDYASVAAATGMRFEVAAAGGSGKAMSCVLQLIDARYPDLTLSAVPSKADARTYNNTVRPKGAKWLPGVGETAYSRTLAPVGAAGPAVEVGWLSHDGRLMSLRYTYPAGAAAAPSLVSRLAALARQVDAR